MHMLVFYAKNVIDLAITQSKLPINCFHSCFHILLRCVLNAKRSRVQRVEFLQNPGVNRPPEQRSLLLSIFSYVLGTMATKNRDVSKPVRMLRQAMQPFFIFTRQEIFI